MFIYVQAFTERLYLTSVRPEAVLPCEVAPVCKAVHLAGLHMLGYVHALHSVPIAARAIKSTQYHGVSTRY